MTNNRKKWIHAVAAAAALTIGGTAAADNDRGKSDDCKLPLQFSARLSGAQEVQAVNPGNIERASVSADFARDLSSVRVSLRVKGGDSVVAAHFHCGLAGRNGPVAFGLFSPGTFVFDGERATGVLTNANFTGADCVPNVGRPVSNVAALALAMREGLIYANVHTTQNPAGEVRGQMLEGCRND